MNSCKIFADELDDVAAGGAPSAQFTNHLDACAACRAGFARRRALLARVDSTTRVWMAAEPSAHLATRIVARVAAERRSRGTPALPWRLAAGTALTALIAVGVYEGAVHAPARHTTAAVAVWRSPTSTLLPRLPALFDLRSRGHLLYGENHAV